MADARYLIVGSGMAADAAVRGIREVDPDGTIALIGAEADPPYKRPPLSKDLWNGKPLDKIWSHTDQLGVELHLGRKVRWLDPRGKHVVDDHGTVYGFDKLLLATGSTPRRLPLDDHRIIYFRTVQDYRRLRSLADRGRHIVVIGGGFIGAEIAAALASNGKAVTMVFPNEAIGDQLFPRDLAQSLNDYYGAWGVQVLTGTAVIGMEALGERSVLRLRRLKSGVERDLVADGVVAGIGTYPNTDLAHSGGLAISDGIVVDRFLRTTHPDIYAAGDVANVHVPALGERRRIEHEDQAKTMGRAAGRAMAGEPAPYDHLPFFYSDMFDLGYEAVGDLDPSLETTAEWTEPYRTGVVTYRRDGRIRGVLLWNVWDQVEAARQLIMQREPVASSQLRDHLLATQ